MDINEFIQMVEQDAIQEGIDFKSPVTKEFVKYWCDHEVKEAIEMGNYDYAYGLCQFNDWVQKY